MLYGVLKRMELTKIARTGSLRLYHFSCLLHLPFVGFTGEARHALAVVYFVLLLLALSYPLKQARKGQLPFRLWRISGFIFLIVGIVWILAVPFWLPLHSNLILKSNVLEYGQAKAAEDLFESVQSLNRLVELEPMNWYWYYLRANAYLKLSNMPRQSKTLSGHFFLEPYLTSPRIFCGGGQVWSP